MFMHFTYKEFKTNRDKHLFTFTYILHDSEFTAQLALSINIDIYASRGDASLLPSGIISTYSQHLKSQKEIATNLALFYKYSTPENLNFEKIKKFVSIDKDWTDMYFPNLKFGEKYYRCTLNQINKINYTGAPYAKHLIGTIQ